MKKKYGKLSFYVSIFLFLALVVGLAMPMQTAQATPVTSIVYDAIPNPLPPNMASQPFQAGQASEFGDYVHLTGTDRILKTITVTMSDWALNSDYPAMPSGGWNHPITLNIYNVIPGAPNLLGSLLGTVTQTFTIPWRPAEDPTNCPTKTSSGYAYKWQSTPGAPDTNCNNGLAFTITFDMSSLNLILPNDIVVGVAYNTQSWGVAPIGVAGPYNSLNVGAEGLATVGTDDNTDKVFFNSLTPGQYGDGGAGGVGTFREDINWTPYGTVPIQITTAPDCTGTLDCYVDAVNGNDANGGASFADAKKTIQAGVNAVGVGGTVHVAAGTYVENVIVTKALTLEGTGRGVTIVQPNVSDPNCGGGGGGSLCSGSSNVFLVQADNVIIHDLTVDGDNPALTSAYNVNGANLDARNGIITNHLAGVYNGLEVYNVTVKNIYLRGMYASSGGTFNFHNNTVTNVQAEYASIAMFAYGGGPGIMANNIVSYANDAISANHSKGIQFLNNTVTNSGSGIHTDNSGDGGGVADLIQGNNVDCTGTTSAYGIWVFVPYIAPTVNNNTVTNCDYGLSAWGTGAAVTTQFTNNIVTGNLATGGVGAYITTDMAYYGYSDVNVNFSGNVITNYEKGVFLDANMQTWEPDPYVAKTINSTFHSNQISGNTSGADMGTTGTYIADFKNNWWGSASGPSEAGPGTGDSVSANIVFDPWLCDGTDTQPNVIGFQPNSATSPCATIKVHIAKYLDGTQADATSAGGYQFPMVATWSAANIGSGSGNYVLGNGHGGTPLLYQADTSFMTVGADYTTSEVTSGGSKVGLSCGDGAVYRLVGYKTSLTSFGDALEHGELNTTAPTFTGLTADQYIIVLNETCPALPTLTVVKDLVPNTDTGMFNLTIDSTIYATNVGDGGTTGAVALNAGTHTVGEAAGTGTSLTNYLTTIGGDCASDGTIMLALGENKTCTITNTKVNANPAIALDKQGPIVANANSPLTYNYLVSNPGNVPLGNVNVSDDKCAPVNYGSGDNGNTMLDPGETWTFTCTYSPSFSSKQLTNTAKASGKYNAQTVSAIDKAILTPFQLQKTLYLYWDESTSKHSNSIMYTAPDNTIFTINVSKGGSLVGTYTISQSNPLKLWLSDGEYTFEEVNLPTGYLAVDASFDYSTLDGHGFHYTFKHHDFHDDGKRLTMWTFKNVVAYDLAIDKTGPANARKGSTITYYYNVTNSGPASIMPKVSDDKCSKVIYVSGDANRNKRVDPGETWIFKCDYKVSGNVGSQITSTATVTDAQQPKSSDVGGDINVNNNKDTWTLTVIK